MPSLSDLLRMGKQYIGDALPGGSLNPEVYRQSVLDGAAMALSPVPVLGDLVGLGADANRYATDPESRTTMNYGLTALGALPFVPGMTAWHASPYKFDKFQMDKIGTGQGAQSYGHGLYLAESNDVGNEYLKEMRGKAASEISSVENRLQIARNIYNNKSRPTNERLSAKLDIDSITDELNTTKAKFYPSLYKTDIPDEAVARFLDWDKPLSQQAPEVQNKLLGHNVSGGRMAGDRDPLTPALLSDRFARNGGESASWAYQQLADELGGATKAADYLKQQGIPGIRYLDGGSRSAGQGSSNFVAFDPEMIRILERNGQPTGQVPWKPNEWRPLNDLLNPRTD